jgi:hypothetical protein
MSVLAARPIGIGETRKPFKLEMLLASYLTAVVLVACVGINERMCHWFVIPVFVCGLLIGPDALRWLRGKYDLFDPKGLVGALGWHLFFLAPLLFIRWNMEMLYVDNPADWRPWVGYLSILNVVALVTYQRFHSIGFHRPVPNKRTQWMIDARYAPPVFLVFGAAALMAQAYYFLWMGGIAGVVETASQTRETGRLADPAGLGLLQIAGQSLPMIALIYLTLIRARLRLKQASFVTIVVLLFLLGVIQFLLAGFTGSRSATIWPLFWIAGVVHYFWRPIGRRSAIVGLVVLGLFMYIYGFYKGGGPEAIEMLATGRASFSSLELATDRTFEQLVITDLSRVDVQSYELYRLLNSTDYTYRWGKTYASALISYVPSWIWKAKPPDTEKVVAGTDLLLGRRMYSPGDRFRDASWVYGLGGEAMLNFGFFAAPFPFAIWGFLMGRYRRAMLTWPSKDARKLLAPFATLLLMMALFSDLDNLIGLFCTGGFVVFLVLLIKANGQVLTQNRKTEPRISCDSACIGATIFLRTESRR